MIIKFLYNRNIVPLILFHIIVTVGWTEDDHPRDHGMDVYLSVINGDTIPDSGFVRVTYRQFMDVRINSSGFPEFTRRTDGGYRETKYVSGWKGNNYFWKEVTDPSVPFSTDLKSGQMGNLGWDEFNNDLHIHSLDKVPIPGSSEEAQRETITDNKNRLKDYLTLDLGSYGTWKYISGQLRTDSDDIYGVPLFDDMGNVHGITLHFISEGLMVEYKYEDWTVTSDYGLYPRTITRSGYYDGTSKIETDFILIFDELINYIPLDSDNPFHWEVHVLDTNDLQTFFFIGGHPHYKEGTKTIAVGPKPITSPRNNKTAGLIVIAVITALSCFLIVRSRHKSS